MNTPKGRIPIIDAFCGIGGMHLGAEALGLDTVLAVDHEPRAIAAMHAGGCAEAVEADVTTVDWAGWLSTPAGQRWAKSPTRLFHASPPCQGWSTSGSKKGALDPRNLFPAVFEALDALRDAGAPATHVTLENVASKPLRIYTENQVLPMLRARFTWCTSWVLEAANFGVPQSRVRRFTVAGPNPMITPRSTHADGHVPASTVVGPGWIRNEQDGAKGRPTDQPAPTVSTKGTHYFYTEDPGTRVKGGGSTLAPGAVRVTANQAAGLQGFPEGWAERVGATHQLVGNSVPPALAAAVIRSVLILTMPVGGATLPPETGRNNTLEGAEDMEASPAPAVAPLPTRTFITSIDFALKNGGGSLEKLTPRILWIGTNGCGKSSWPDAVALAETGIADALAGKSRKDGTLFALSPAGALDEIFAKVTHSDGTVATWKTERITKKHRDGTTSTTVKDPDQRGPYDPALIFPLRPLLDALIKGGVDRQRRFFLDAAGGALSGDEIKAAVEKVIRADVSNTEADVTNLLARYDQGITDVTARKKLGATEALQALQAHAGAQQRQASDEKDMATRTVNEAAAGLADNPGDADMEAAAEELILLTTQLQAAQEGIGSKGFSPFIEVADFRAEGQTNKAALLQVQAELEGTEDIPEDEKAVARAKIMAALDILAHAHLDKELGKCFLCGEAPGVEALAARATTLIASVQKRRLADADAQADRQTYLDLQARIEPLRRKQHRIRDAVPFIQHRAKLTPLKYAAEKQLEDLRGARAAHTGLGAARALVPVKAAAATEWSALTAVCKAVSKELLDGLAPVFAERVNRYMPDNWRFGLELFADGREVCNWGLLRCAECHGAGCDTCEGSGVGEVLHAFTSGGEWAGTLAAVAAATVPDDYDGLVILVVPDADFHPDVRKTVLEALVNFPGVVLATATQKPTGAKLKDWTYCTRQDDGSWKVQTGTKTISGAKGSKAKKTGTKAANKDAKRSAGKAAKVKFSATQLTHLECLGYDGRQIERMSKATAKAILNDGVSATGISILQDGSMMRPTHVDVDEGDGVGVDDLVVEAVEAAEVEKVDLPSTELEVDLPSPELPPEPDAIPPYNPDDFDDLLD